MLNCCTAICLLLLCSVSALGTDLPLLRGRVNDYAAILSPQAVQRIEHQLAQLELTDSTQVVVLTVPSLQGQVLEEFSIKVAEAWRIGQKGLDNGAILLVAKAERKIRIEVGRGLEGKLTDLISGRIIRSEIAPRFKNGDFDGGVSAGIIAIHAAVKGEYKAKDVVVRNSHKKSGSFWMVVLAVLVGAAVLGTFSRPLGAVAGAIGAPAAAWFLFPAASVLLLILLAVAGFLVGLFLAELFGGGGGGYWGGGPFFGGWYGGGGGGSDQEISGGGGDFGGGGSSDEW